MNPSQNNARKPVGPLQDLASVWRGDELASSAAQGQVVPTGHAALNAQLPGGGWPVGALVEVLQAHSGQNDWRLLLPALCQLQASHNGVVVLVGAPYAPFAPGLAGQGLNPQRLLCVNTAAPASRLWATEQALRCKDVAAVLAWLPQARADALRRLQISAAEHQKLLFVMRPVQAQHEASPAVLRLLTANAQEHPVQDRLHGTAQSEPQNTPQADSNNDALTVNILKRRGPPLEQALALQARPARLAALLLVSALPLDRCNKTATAEQADYANPAVQKASAQPRPASHAPPVQSAQVLHFSPGRPRTHRQSTVVQTRQNAPVLEQIIATSPI
jgi:protein ImuA